MQGRKRDGSFKTAVAGTANAATTLLLDYGALDLGGATSAANHYLSVTSTTDGESGATSAFSDCVRIPDRHNFVDAQIMAAQTGPVLDDIGLEVEVTENDPEKGVPNQQAKSTGGMLWASRFTVAPSSGHIEGAALAPDGSEIEPNGVSTQLYWHLRTDTIEGITYSACMDISPLEGVNEPGQLLVAHRPNGKEKWTPYPSTLKGSSLCANGLTELGDLAIAADSLVNMIPIDGGPTDEPGPGEIPEEYALFPPYPNPFNPSTNLKFDLPEPRRVLIDAFDMLGRRVAILQNGDLNAGSHIIRFDADGLASGVYIIRVFIDGIGQTTRNVTLMK